MNLKEEGKRNRERFEAATARMPKLPDGSLDHHKWKWGDETITLPKSEFERILDALHNQKYLHKYLAGSRKRNQKIIDALWKKEMLRLTDGVPIFPSSRLISKGLLSKRSGIPVRGHTVI